MCHIEKESIKTVSTGGRLEGNWCTFLLPNTLRSKKVHQLCWGVKRRTKRRTGCPTVETVFIDSFSIYSNSPLLYVPFCPVLVIRPKHPTAGEVTPPPPARNSCGQHRSHVCPSDVMFAACCAGLGGSPKDEPYGICSHEKATVVQTLRVQSQRWGCIDFMSCIVVQFSICRRLGSNLLRKWPNVAHSKQSPSNHSFFILHSSISSGLSLFEPGIQSKGHSLRR